MRAMVTALVALGLGLAGPAAAQSGPTQSRDGLGTGAHTKAPTGSTPAGGENATSGPQGRPAYPSGSSTANPGAAFVRNQPRPATGAAASPPGVLSTTTVDGQGRTQTRPGANPATTEGAAPLPPR